MIKLIRAEFLKLRTTQVWFWLLLADVAIAAAIAIGSLAANAIKKKSDVAYIFATSNTAAIIVIVLGILGITTEYRYQTITPTVLGTPSRWAIVSAKLVVFSLVGLAYAIACLAVQIAIAGRGCRPRTSPSTSASRTCARSLLGLPAVFVLYSVIGVGIGALLRNQILAITLALVFLLVVQNIVAAIPGVRHAWNYLPGGATTTILYPHDTKGPGSHPAYLVGVGLLILLLWSLVPAAPSGATFTMNRDIT